MGQLTDTHKAQILAYPYANHSMAEIGRKIGFSKSAICIFLSFYLGGMPKNKADRKHKES